MNLFVKILTVKHVPMKVFLAVTLFMDNASQMLLMSDVTILHTPTKSNIIISVLQMLW